MPKSTDWQDASFPAAPKVKSAGESRTYEIELLTPMFGGGAETGVNDPTFPIRPTAIRGQLQFWWRATVGAQYANKEELRAAQSDLWGSTERASRVQVRVDEFRFDRPKKDERNLYRSMPNWKPPFNNTALPYALFPFQGPASCIQRGSFRLILVCPENLWPQVEPAVWAWVNFGGLGSRTRRGCGSIICKNLAPQNAQDLTVRLQKLQGKDAPSREWPTLGRLLLPKDAKEANPIAAWDEVIGLLRDFRQFAGFARNPGESPNQPGRSRYPEPETIRKLTESRMPKHQRLSDIPEDSFPRAEFGLPIVFHFKDQGDPPETVLYPSVSNDGSPRERMASPLVLKPLALANGKAVPMILRLNAPPLDGVELRKKEERIKSFGSESIRRPELSGYTHSPLKASANGSALEAFWEYAKSKGFTEVAP